MKVIWRQRGSDWEIASGKHYQDETQLQRFLSENPQLIPFEEISKDILPPRVMLREVGLPGSGSTDIVGIDEVGGITVIECKLATNPEIKRKVIGQVLEYAAFLWRKSYRFLDDICQNRIGTTLVEAMHSELDAESLEDWTEMDFIQSVTRSLSEGDFKIVVAVDSVNEELHRTIEFLTEGPSSLQIYALELTYFSTGEREILVPHLYGTPIGARGTPTGRTTPRWTEETFFNDVAERILSEGTARTIHALLKFSKDRASRIYWGTGKETGSFTFHQLLDDQVLSLFSVYSNGTLSINFGYLSEKLPIDYVSSYWERLRKIGGLSNLSPRDDFHSWPTVSIEDAFRSHSDFDEFAEAVTDFIDEVLAAHVE